MATTIGEILTRLDYRANNAAGDISSVITYAAVNAAIAEINRRCPFLLTSGVITGDGTSYSFDLTDDAILVPDFTDAVFHRLMAVSIEGYGYIKSHSDGISYIRKLRAQTSSMNSMKAK